MARQPKSNNAKARVKGIDTYWDRTQWPLQSLCFLLPLLVLYELGTLYYVQAGHRISAERMLLDAFYELFGVFSYYLPPLIVVVVLLSWHVVRRDPWKVQPGLYALMSVESIVLALPLFVFGVVVFREMPAAAFAVDGAAFPLVPAPPQHTWREELVFSIGAGIYEELMFRLIAIALLHMLLVDLLALPDIWGAAGSVFGSAIAFALYHFPPFWDWSHFTAAFNAPRFAFYAFAGIYFAAVYVLRGFGIVAAVHAVYDVMAVAVAHDLLGLRS